MKVFLPILIAAGTGSFVSVALMAAFIAAAGGMFAEGLGGWLFCLALTVTFARGSYPFVMFAIPVFLLLIRTQSLSWYSSACVGGLVAAMFVAAVVFLGSFDPENAAAEIWDAAALTSVTVANHGTPTTVGWAFLWNRVGGAGVVGAFGGIVFWLTLGLLTRRAKV